MAEVKRKHRALAYEAAFGVAIPGGAGWAWVENGGDAFVSTARHAQALADIEAEALAAAPQPMKAERDERERAHLLEGARLLSEHMAWHVRKAQLDGYLPRADLAAWLEAERARLAAAIEPARRKGRR